ncbi:hypothetical protein [Serratia symbiotica]|uniref:hypothetical protein n=1 Tax=Serratia symbiotica TaxID=138074 RepID=UPI0030D15B34
MYALPKRCPFTGLFIPNPIYSTKLIQIDVYLIFVKDGMLGTVILQCGGEWVL